MVLIDFSLTVKAATLIFISVRVLAISSAKEGKSGFNYNLYRVNKLSGPCKRVCIHESPDSISLTSHVLILKAHITKTPKFLLSTETF